MGKIENPNKPLHHAIYWGFLGWAGGIRTHGMPESKSGALPLGDTPIALNKLLNDFLNWLGYEDSNLGMPESESGALPLGDTPTICLDYRKIDNLNLVATTGFEPVTPSL